MWRAACIGVHMCFLGSMNSHVLCFPINVALLKWYVDLRRHSQVSYTHLNALKPLWDPHCSLLKESSLKWQRIQGSGYGNILKTNEAFDSQLCAERSCQEVSVSTTSCSRTRTARTEHHLEFDGEKKNRFSLESLFSFTIKSLIIIIIIVEKWVFSTYKREKSHHSLI